MKIKLSSLLLAAALLSLQAALSQDSRPKIGITLSGGGAKGIAHIGLLKAIDSAGLKVDYVTGTSMGSIVGGLYAVGYTADDILGIAEKLDWSSLLSNDPSVGSLSLKEKKESGQYIELPLLRGKMALKRGFIESNELWLVLNELYFPYFQTTDFGKFDKGFLCIATDVKDGKMVVLKEGNIVDAVRASMAIPSIFTPVEIDGRVLVDGGITRNFPVSNAREMGASIVIGSDVSGGLDPVEKLQSPIDVISRLPFYNAVADLEVQKKLVDIYVDYPLENYGTGSFSSARQIIDIGLKKGRELYPSIKRLKDSLDLIYGKQEIEIPARRRDSILLSGYEVRGIPPSEIPEFLELVNFRAGAYYTAGQISAAIRSAFATRGFSKISYSLAAASPESARILFDIDRAPTTFARFGVHYNTATGIALKSGFVKRGFLAPYSTTSFDFSIGENARAKIGFWNPVSKSRKLLFQAQATVETVDINTYNPEFSKTGLYNQGSQNTDVQLLWQCSGSWALGLGTSLTYVAYEPKILSPIEAKGNSNFISSYLSIQHNTLNANTYPTRGRQIYIRGALVYGQHMDFKIYQEGSVVATDDALFFSSRPYAQLKVELEQYIPIGKNALFMRLHSGMNFNYRQAIMNDFVIGGLTSVIRNQVTFAGLPEASIFTASAASMQLGYQHALTSNLFLTARANALYYDFIDSNFRLNTAIPNHGIGYSLTAGYKTFLGPLEASLMYSGFNRKVLPYFNLGYVLALD